MTYLIPADLDKFVKQGIQTGTADQRMAELSTLQRQLLQEQDFHFTGGALLAKVDEVTDPQEGRNKLERDWDALLDVAEQLMQQLHSSGFFHQPGKDGNATAEGVKCEVLETIPAISIERIARRYAIDLIKTEANAIYKEQNKDAREALLQKSLIGPTLFKSAIKFDLDESDPEVQHDLYGLIQSIISQGLHKLYLDDPVVDIYEDAEGVHIITGTRLHITVDNVDFNSQFGGNGYTPPRDRYRLKRILKFDNQPDVSKAKLERGWSTQRLINDIKRITSIEALLQHRKEVTEELYHPDKRWKAKWGQAAENEVIDKLVRDTIAGPQIITKQITTHTHTVVFEDKSYSARVDEGESVTISSWYDHQGIRVSTSLGQKLVAQLAQSETIPEIHTETVTLVPIKEARPVDEETLRQLVWRERRRWNWLRQQATQELNFTTAQWQEIYGTYNTQLELLKKTSHVREAVESFTSAQSMQLLQDMVANTPVAGLKNLWNDTVTPLLQRKLVKHGEKALVLNVSQFPKIRKLILAKMQTNNTSE